MGNEYFIVALILICTAQNALSAKIHILEQSINPVENKQSIVVDSLDSPFSKMCIDILSTSSYIGRQSFEIYKMCEDKYHLFGSTDNELLKNRPICFDYLEQFFCNYKIGDQSDDKQCEDLSNTEFIIALIKGCIASDEDSSSKYSCPSLDLINYKVKNPELFCSKAEKKEIGLLSENYIHIPTAKRDSCQNIIKRFNMCIDSDNLLYPYSNYRKCLTPNNRLYECNSVSTIKERENKIV
jgi:hypothetical protein